MTRIQVNRRYTGETQGKKKKRSKSTTITFILQLPLFHCIPDVPQALLQQEQMQLFGLP